jgi:integrase
VATEWLALQDQWTSLGHRKHVERMLFDHGAALCLMGVCDITINTISTVLQPLLAAHPQQGRRTLRVWGQVFKRAKALGLLTGDNPALLHREQLPKRSNHTQHHPSMPYAEVPSFVRELRMMQDTSAAARAMEFCILTATRTNETLGAQRQEFDLAERMWTIPGARTKTRKPFRVPLSDRAVQIIADSKLFYVFPGQGLHHPLCDRALRWMMRKLPYTPHGFRSSFAMWGQCGFRGLRTGVPIDCGH